ncbi:bleomycin resistance family protein [Flavobacterium sp. Sd200]|nr:bleomycin resistance family protein [Flavobacterium sp. Sd200]
MKFKKSIPALPVINISQAIEFYENKMGFKVRHREESFAIIVRDELEIHLWASCDKSWKYRSLLLFLKPVWSGAESFLAGTASCRVEVSDIDGLFKEYKTRDILHNENTIIREQYWGQRDFSISDLYGNLITFYEEMD